MLRRLEPATPFRSLSRGFWPTDLPLGRRSAIYGHNGSGKSSFASLLLEIASDATSVPASWEDDAGTLHSIAPGKGGPSPAMAVFTKEWVSRNLSDFLDGSTASPIVTLGEEAIEAKEQEIDLANRISELRAEESDARKKTKDAAAKAEKLAREAQDAIAAQLREFDYTRFTKNKYALPVVEGLLHAYKGDFPDENESVAALKRLSSGVPDRITPVSEAPTGGEALLAGLADLLAETPTSVALDSLAVSQERQRWAEEGIRLHENSDDCLFCGGVVTEARRQELARHFDKSWFDIRARAQSLLDRVRALAEAFSNWNSAIPLPELFLEEQRAAYDLELQRVRADVESRLASLEAVVATLATKVEGPQATPSAPDISSLSGDVEVATLQQAVGEHNQQVDEYAVVAETRFDTVLNHIVGSRATIFRQHHANAQAAAAAADAANAGADLAERTLTTLRQKQFSNSKMAQILTNDLARVYGKNHLTVTVTDDGKSYACKRGDEPATHLSDGERTTLSLLYFLRKLEDESISGDKSARIVVIDDPSSSLDREALFATHQWLVDTLDGFGQYIVLTHDFGLLRLFLKSLANAWGDSRGKIKKGNADEERFPKVSFLEMYAASADGVRRTKVAPLPSMLVKNTTEYAYLFSKVMEGIVEGADHDRLFLLPNAARRVLEVFTSYRAPHLGNFLQRLEDVMGGDHINNPYRDVYDFCNRYSHGEGSEAVGVLDARATHGHIRRCMEFLRFADPEHFDRLCRATGIDSAALE